MSRSIAAPSIRLAECEAIIERGLATFVEVGKALLRIRDERLYRESHGTFEDYCRERWSMDRIHAHRHIEAAAIVAALSIDNTVPRPTNVAVTRELAPLRPEPEQLRETWIEAVERHGEQPTAAQVREVVQERKAAARKEAPLVPDITDTPGLTAHQIEVADANRARIYSALHTLGGMCRGLEEFNLSRAAATLTDDDRREWRRIVSNAMASLRRFRDTVGEA